MPRKRRDLPWLDERGGVYYACWYDEADRRTKRLSLRTRDGSEAKTRFAAFLLEGESIYSEPKKSGLTVAEIINLWLKEHADVKLAQPQHLRARLQHIINFMGHRYIGDVDVMLCRDYVAKRLEEDEVATGSVRFELSRLKTAANHAVLFRHITAAELPSVELSADSPPRTIWLTLEEMEKLRAACDQVTQDFVDLCYYTASRRMAIETLTWFQVDLERGRINLAKPGEKQTRKRRPIVPIDAKLLPVLKRLSAERTGERVLPTGITYEYWLERACKQAGVTRATPHTLRHSRATHLLQAGVDIYAVAKLLGDSVQTVERTYAHACPLQIGEIIAAKTGA